MQSGLASSRPGNLEKPQDRVNQTGGGGPEFAPKFGMFWGVDPGFWGCAHVTIA